MNPAAVVIEPYLAADLIGFSAGLVITVLLLVLTVRAARLPGTPWANILLALCALTWNVGGLAHTMARGAGLPGDAYVCQLTTVVQFTGAALWPLPLLSIWHSFAVGPSRRHASWLLKSVAYIPAVLLLISFWLHVTTGAAPIPFERAKQLAAISGSVLSSGAVFLLLRGAQASRAMRVSALTILLGVFTATLSIIVHRLPMLDINQQAAVRVLGQQSMLLAVLGSFFLFARFRFADVFLRYSLRIVSAAAIVSVLVLIIDARLLPLAGADRTMRLFVHGLLATAVLVSFIALDRWLDVIIDPWIVRDRDYRQASRRLGETLGYLHQPQDIADAARAASRMTLDLADAQVLALERLPSQLWPADVADGEIVEFSGAAAAPLRQMLGLPDLELLVPIRTGGHVTAVLAVSPGVARRGLVTHEISYLRTLATEIGSRLDALRHERELVERQHQESLLRQQVTEAELRALRAQIDPHFLFNSLNTIADLIVTNPPGAEAMTLRLAKVFRHVLTQSSRPMTSIREEADFLEAYLQIEEERFGDRLQIAIDIAPDVNRQQIPSLILQPLVENALKHGLAPKTGRGHLWIAARADGDSVRITVEDDGVGLAGTRTPDGVGLKNVSQRLSVTYDDRGSLQITPREHGGTRVTIRLPLSREVRALAG